MRDASDGFYDGGISSALARALLRPANRATSIEIKRLSWNDIRFPLPERPGLSESLLLESGHPGVYIIEKMNNGRAVHSRTVVTCG